MIIVRRDELDKHFWGPSLVIVLITFVDVNKFVNGNPFYDVVVIALIFNYQIWTIMINPESLLNIIFKRVHEKMKLRAAHFTLITGLLYIYFAERSKIETMIILAFM